ncbi:MAG TPA: hypothetical protein VJG49_00655 [Candidatus Nanoarchaeia archaeon]|nr:hypothetical protein [Candidatus Nanoarchaeia archaeon]
MTESNEAGAENNPVITRIIVTAVVIILFILVLIWLKGTLSRAGVNS